MRLNLLKRILAVPTCSRQEGRMVAFLLEHVRQRGPARCGEIVTDEWNNVFIRKGSPGFLPCVAAHLDTVHPPRRVEIVQQDGILFGVDEQGQRTGIGADDKAGVYICLELLERFDNIAVVLFAQEEIGCLGAYHAPAAWFEKVGYVVEFDCPGAGLLSYTSGGERLFKNDGELIKRGLPVLQKHGATKWQRHPYSDVMALRQRFCFECLNLSAGYRRWHRDDEHVDLAEVAAALDLGEELVRALGEHHYSFRRGKPESANPPIEVTTMTVDEPETWQPEAASR